MASSEDNARLLTDVQVFLASKGLQYRVTEQTVDGQWRLDVGSPGADLSRLVSRGGAAGWQGHSSR